jgi:hypothetical protein
MSGSRKILQFRRRRAAQKKPVGSGDKPRRRPLGGRTNDMWGPCYWPCGLRTWMLIAGLGPPIVLAIAWLFGWRTDWL